MVRVFRPSGKVRSIINSYGSWFFLLLKDCAVASSGDTYRFVEIDGVRYSHIIDPTTGLGVPGQRVTTVIAPSAVLADALATALNVAGPDKGLEMIRKLDEVSAQFVHRSVGKEEILYSAGFPSHRGPVSPANREQRLSVLTTSSRGYLRVE